MAARHNWDVWENQYVTGTDDITLEFIHNLPGAPGASSVRRYAADHEWTLKRKNYRDRAAAKALEKALEASGSNMGEIVAEYTRQTASLRSIAALGINQNIDAIRAGKAKLSLSQTLAVIKLSSEVDRSMIGLVRDQDARVSLLFNLFIDVIEEVVPDVNLRKQAIRRMSQALEDTRL